MSKVKHFKSYHWCWWWVMRSWPGPQLTQTSDEQNTNRNLNSPRCDVPSSSWWLFLYGSEIKSKGSLVSAAMIWTRGRIFTHSFHCLCSHRLQSTTDIPSVRDGEGEERERGRICLCLRSSWKRERKRRGGKIDDSVSPVFVWNKNGGKMFCLDF